MEIKSLDNERLVLSKNDVQHLYTYLRHSLLVPNLDKMGAEELECMKHFWNCLSALCTPTDFQEVKKDLEYDHKY